MILSTALQKRDLTPKQGCSGVETSPTPFRTSNLTWRIRFFISISTCSAGSSI